VKDQSVPITKEMLDCLEKFFPLQTVRLDQTERQIWHEAGQRSVVEWAKAHFNRQQAASLGATPRS